MRSFGQLWPTLKRLLAYGSPWRKPLSVAVMMLWIAAAAEVSGPLLISYFIDNMVARHHLPLGKVAGLAAAYVGLQFLAAGLHYAQSLLFNRAAVGVVQSLRTDVMDAALRQPLSAFDTQPVGQLISRVTNDTEVIRDLYVTVVATVLRSAALIGAMLVAMFSLDWRMALVGHTGSGKSTLASLLMGYYPLTQGEIRLDGREISSLNHRVLRQGVAMVQQDPVVMADTFLANVTLGRDVSEAQVWQALETVQLADLARGLSDGLHTHLGEQGNTLSVGQKQLLALARVLVDAPQILILDEATASIDSGTEQAIQQALAAIRERTTLVVIAHRLSTIVEADTILVLHRGQAVERGTHQQLLAAQGRYWQMYQLQLVGEELAASVHEEPGPAA